MPRQSHREILIVEELTSKKEEECPPKVELKPLPSHLRYEFLDFSHQFSIIVNDKLDGPQLEQLLDVLRKHRGAIGYSIDDIQGLSPSFACTAFFLMTVITHPDNLSVVSILTCKRLLKKRLLNYLMLGSSTISQIVSG